jgi:Recombination endonuclease VII
MFDPEVAEALGEVEFSLDEIFSEASESREKRLIPQRARNNKRRLRNPLVLQTERNWRNNNRDRNNATKRIWAKANPEKLLDKAMRRYYGITAFEYRSMEYVQNGVCLTCEGTNPCGSRLAVDHCHPTEKIRGLLCIKCNVAAGLARENPGLLRKIADHVEGGGFGL